MTADPRDGISEITEIDEDDIAIHVRAFIRAVLWGAMAGGGLFLVFTLPIGVGLLFGGELKFGLGLALAPLVISGSATLVGMVVVGLPLTAFLKEYRRESQTAYAFGGGLGGFLLPVLFFALLEGFDSRILPDTIILGSFGILAGGVAGNVWGNWREKLARMRADVARRQSANPFHDMIH